MNADGVVVEMKGDSPSPAKVQTASTVTTIPVVKAQPITVKPDGTHELTLVEPTIITTRTAHADVTGPVSFEPPKPPTHAEISTETRKKWMYGALAVGLVAAVFGLVRGWEMLMLGGAAVAVAAYLAIFIQDHPAITLIICAAGGFAVAGPYIWHRVVKKIKPDNTNEPTSS